MPRGLSQQYASNTAGANPRNYSTDYPPGVDGPQIAAEVLDYVRQAQAKNSFMRPSIKDTFETIRKQRPDLTLDKFQRVLGAMHAKKELRLDPYTQALVTLQHPEYAMPLDRELKNYLDLT